ncbi:hypothetical protein J25TS5_14810 [Paenibacillus faecis]|uniref:hypothetical protein n=1 Tax=Paenibacillus faecis TaxID=862114 RepID=UPI001B1BA7ED|nr:hypothetical protein [Paenibacillus faecis]GIO84549.1 hypothetical protein J25TS5_14810 [Paenibacillus faecis]
MSIIAIIIVYKGPKLIQEINYAFDTNIVASKSFNEEAAYNWCVKAAKSYAVKPEEAVFETLQETSITDNDNKRQMTIAFFVSEEFGGKTETSISCDFNGNNLVSYDLN